MDNTTPMPCFHCGAPIPAARLKALPKTRSCVGCSDTQKVSGIHVVRSKTEYAELYVAAPAEIEALRRQSRKRFGANVRLESATAPERERNPFEGGDTPDPAPTWGDVGMLPRPMDPTRKR